MQTDININVFVVRVVAIVVFFVVDVVVVDVVVVDVVFVVDVVVDVVFFCCFFCFYFKFRVHILVPFVGGVLTKSYKYGRKHEDYCELMHFFKKFLLNLS